MMYGFLVPIIVLISILVCWFLFRIFKDIQGIKLLLLGIELTVFGLFMLALWKLAMDESDFLLNLAIIFSVFGTVLSILSAFKKN
ncbi:hypothetical protein ACFQWB_16810 [Paenibacillus thermoaerophilus]|uniref:YesK-like protein n=1 Tax=Paenibacillus thermoaerophilus TaxID=1215385 RepID=A0ABW2V604_9BACL|nr:hypothetical protein [Paenibacillus thermoaerophilus]TMV06656.1 hypothetical protein FE781_16485 [Paenibacillus thermoaerophilus]